MPRKGRNQLPEVFQRESDTYSCEISRGHIPGECDVKICELFRFNFSLFHFFTFSPWLCRTTYDSTPDDMKSEATLQTAYEAPDASHQEI